MVNLSITEEKDPKDFVYKNLLLVCVLKIYCVLNNNAFKLFLKEHMVI